MSLRITSRALIAVVSSLAAGLAAALPPAQAAPESPVAGVSHAARATRIVQPVPGPAERDRARHERAALHRAAANVPSPARALGPGSYLVIDRPDGSFLCTAGFVFSQGSQLLLGTAGHCFVPADKTATHGPGADLDPATIKVYACVDNCFFGGQLGGLNPLIPLGAVRYARQTSNGIDVGHDFGLVEIPSGTPVRTTLPVWGGPTGVADLAFGQPVCVFGNATGLAETFATMARPGVGVFSDSDVWGATLPSVTGDSGSGVETCSVAADGLHGQRAVGILTHLVGGGLDTVEGTTIAQAQRMALEAGLSISLLGA